MKVRRNGGRKYVERAAVAGPAYKEGVENPRRNWSKATADGSENYKTGVTKAIQNDSFKKGVLKAGDEAWLKGSIEKGVSRYPTGVALAENKYNEKIAPYLDTLEGLSLPPRYSKGDPRNIARVAAIALALHNKKLQIKG